MSLNTSSTNVNSTRSNTLQPMVYYARPPTNLSCTKGNMIMGFPGPGQIPTAESDNNPEQHSEKLGYYRHLYPWHGYGGYWGYPYGLGYGYPFGLGYGGIAPSCFRGMCGRGGYPWYGASFI